MASYRPSLKSPRSVAFNKQSGLCHYCGQPMWQENPDAFAQQHGLTLKQAKQLKCTGEHLVPHKDGGNATEQNIVAACFYCNQKRHKRSRDLSPNEFRSKVQKRMANGKWHPVRPSCHAERLTY
jgi:5-methylcytosine-specific restriction endonuclease McrA